MVDIISDENITFNIIGKISQRDETLAAFWHIKIIQLIMSHYYSLRTKKTEEDVISAYKNLLINCVNILSPQ